MTYIAHAIKDIGRGVGLVTDGIFKLVGPPLIIFGLLAFWFAAFFVTCAAFLTPPWIALEYYHYTPWLCGFMGFLTMMLFIANKEFLTLGILFLLLLIGLREYWPLDFFIAGVGSLFPNLARSTFLTGSTIFKKKEN